MNRPNVEKILNPLLWDYNIDGWNFYLTGGTAPSRHYFNHRYSDDLVLFVNADPRFSEWVQRIFQELEKSADEDFFRIDYHRIVRSESFTQMLSLIHI